MRYVHRMSRIRYVTREYWFELLIAFLAIAGMLELVVGRDSPAAPATTLWIAIPTIAVLVLLLLARRRFPFAAPAGYWLLAMAISFGDGVLVAFVGSLGIVGLASAVLLGNLRNPLKAGAGLVIVLVGMVTVLYNIPGPLPVGDYVFGPLRFVVAWVAGYALRERADQVAAAEVRAAQAEREREAAARVAVAEERSRIARELHDIVAHAVSVMVLQVGAVRHKLPDAVGRGPRRAQRCRAGRPDGTCRRCAICWRRCAAKGTKPSSCLSLASTASIHCSTRSRRAGLPVELHVDGKPLPLPRGIDLSAYRIVQEGLTNALKHARASDADVTVRYRPDELEIEVRDNGRGGAASDGLGHGLIGVRERVKIYGGKMSAGTDSNGGFVLSTSLPIGREER